MINKYIIDFQKLLLGFAFYSIFLIYLIPFSQSQKVNFETFPILLLLSSILIILYIKKLKFDKYEKIILLFILSLILVYLLHLFKFEKVSTLLLIKILVCPIIFLSTYQIIRNINIFHLSSITIFLFILFLIFKLKLPYIFENICDFLSFFIGRMDCTNTTNLDKPFLITPEPSYLSLMCFFLIILIEFFILKYTKLKNHKLNYHLKLISLQIFLLIIMISTDSRSIYIFLLPLFLFKIFSINKKFTPILLVILIIGISLSNISRITNLAVDIVLVVQKTLFEKNNKKIVEMPNSVIKYKNFDYFLAISNQLEPTGMLRIDLNILSIRSFLSSNILIGNGSGHFIENWQKIADKSNLSKIMTNSNEVVKKWDNFYTKKQNPQNYFFLILNDYGIIPILILMILIFKALSNVNKKTLTFDMCAIVFLIYCFFYQGQITNPHHWIILSLLLNKQKLLNEKT